MANSGENVPFAMSKFVLYGGLVLAFPFPLAFLLASPHSPLAELRQYYPYGEIISFGGLGSILLFAILTFAFRKRLLGVFEASSSARAVRAVWIAAAFAIVAFTALPRHHSFALLVPTHLIFIAVAWYVTGEMQKNKIMKILSASTIAGALVTNFLVDIRFSATWLWLYPIDFLMFLIIPAYLFSRKLEA